MSQDYVNPFDDEQYRFSVLRNARGQYSLWPEFAELPAGWESRFGPAARAECVEYVERHWQAINPFAPGVAGNA
ncbi:MbtH family protein [Pseudoduganella armeniaca]|uniref:MbtH family protein n=1 Tax=Pseudoduganella armeniaca TaxID=2072590 RepID=A0A2R4CAF6_9BURK|nr:MbtH family protein [Pseudoduganella armeniaca]AVR96581.1 MbtH family protein [Pseudoduganella armeniaca]